jgi:hypothetical protein
MAQAYFCHLLQIKSATSATDLQQTAREETPQMVGWQRCASDIFRDIQKRSEWILIDEQGYRQYSHIVRVSSTLEASRDCLRKREHALTLWRVQVATISGVKVRANAKFEFVSCLEQDGKGQDVICRAGGDDILATN